MAVVHLGQHALEDAVDQTDVAVEKAALQVCDGIGADDAGRTFDVHASQLGCAGEERVRGDAEPGSDDATDIFAARGDDVESSSGAEVDDDDGTAIARE